MRLRDSDLTDSGILTTWRAVGPSGTLDCMATVLTVSDGDGRMKVEIAGRTVIMAGTKIGLARRRDHRPVRSSIQPGMNGCG
jgi:hypothetical protein